MWVLSVVLVMFINYMFINYKIWHTGHPVHMCASFTWHPALLLTTLARRNTDNHNVFLTARLGWTTSSRQGSCGREAAATARLLLTVALATPSPASTPSPSSTPSSPLPASIAAFLNPWLSRERGHRRHRPCRGVDQHAAVHSLGHLHVKHWLLRRLGGCGGCCCG